MMHAMRVDTVDLILIVPNQMQAANTRSNSENKSMKFYPVADATNTLHIGSLLQFLERITSRLSIFIFACRSTEVTMDAVFTSVSACNSTRRIVDA